MAKAKKFQKYVPATEIPKKDNEWKILDASGKYDDFYEAVKLWEANVSVKRSYNKDYYTKLADAFRRGDHDITKWKEELGSYVVRALYTGIWPHTPEFTQLNDAFMKEFDSREDLQEIYREGYNETYYIYDSEGNHHSKQEANTHGWDKRPQDYIMFRGAVGRSNACSKKIELARETPYLEGDLVLLRKPFIGRRGVDPFYVNPYSEEARNGAVTPDDSVMRIGTVVGVTERVEGYYASKGSKVIQLIWMGVTDSQLIDVEERFIKWHERPTYKNGMKKRPENRE